MLEVEQNSHFCLTNEMRRIDLKKVNVARSNTIRDINRQIVLNYVRERGPISRADIARETDLQRSTISYIVKELTHFNLIKEVYGESSGGRPPALLTLRSARPIAIGVDLGTVKTTVATCDLTGRIIEKEEFWTDSAEERTTSLIIESVRNQLSKNAGTIEGIGVSSSCSGRYKKGACALQPALYVARSADHRKDL